MIVRTEVQLQSYVVNATLYILLDSSLSLLRIGYTINRPTNSPPIHKIKRKKQQYRQTCSHVVIIRHEKEMRRKKMGS